MNIIKAKSNKNLCVRIETQEYNFIANRMMNFSFNNESKYRALLKELEYYSSIGIVDIFCPRNADIKETKEVKNTQETKTKKTKK